MLLSGRAGTLALACSASSVCDGVRSVAEKRLYIDMLFFCLSTSIREAKREKKMFLNVKCYVRAEDGVKGGNGKNGKRGLLETFRGMNPSGRSR